MLQQDILRTKFEKVPDLIEVYLATKRVIGENADFMPAYKEKQQQALLADVQQKVVDIFSNMEWTVTKEKKAADKAVAVLLNSAPFDQRTYYATAVAQDLADKSPSEMIAVFKQMVADGKFAQILEARRLMDSHVDPIKPSWIEWMQVRDDTQWPEEKTAASVTKETGLILEGFKMLQSQANFHINSALPHKESLMTCFDQMAGNVDRQMQAKNMDGDSTW